MWNMMNDICGIEIDVYVGPTGLVLYMNVMPQALQPGLVYSALSALLEPKNL